MEKDIEADILSELIKSDNLDDLVKLNALRAKQKKKTITSHQWVQREQLQSKGISGGRYIGLVVASLMRKGKW